MITMLHEMNKQMDGGMDMRVNGTQTIHDNGEFVTIVTETGTAIHLPIGLEHSITILDIHEVIDEEQVMHRTYDLAVDLNQGSSKDETSI